MDLFLCAYRPVSGTRTGDFVFHDATTGGPNYLFRNDIGDGGEDKWQMTDVTRDCGLDVGSTRYTLAASWEDFDNDGDQDLYVANDYGRNYLYRNDGGRFVDVTRQAGLIDTGFGMSVSWGDYNRDGHLDLYIGNMFSSAGSRITRQPRFQQEASETQRALFQRMAKGNSLFAGSADGTFRDVSGEARVEQAWLLATCPDDGVRNGAVALRLAVQAVKLTRSNNADTWDTLAAALAENRRFEEAVSAAQKANEPAIAAGRIQLAQNIKERSERYRNRQEYRASE